MEHTQPHPESTPDAAPNASRPGALPPGWGRWPWWGAGALALLTVGALAWSAATHSRLRQLERELVSRQQQSQTEATEASLLAKQAQDATRDAAAKMALLEARVAEASVQRSQLDDLIQSLSRSRDENLLADLEAALRVAQQQSALTGSADPLVSTLKQADERLARYNQPRLERVRRAVLRDLERVQANSQVDVPALVIRLDEVVRQADDLPMPGRPSPLKGPAQAPAPAAKPGATTAAAPAPGAPWQALSQQAWFEVDRLGQQLWAELRSLIRITKIDHPESVLASPEQVFFLRENLKLRLLNARLALLSRQFDIAQSDIRDALNALDRYFDPQSKRTAAAVQALKQISVQARQVTTPRPDDTLAVIAAVNAGR